MKYQYFCGDEKQILIHITDYMIHAYGKHLNYLNLRIIKPYIQRHLMLFFSCILKRKQWSVWHFNRQY